MSNKKELSISLTAKYFSGSATPDEVMELHESLNDPEVKAEFDKMSKLWQASAGNNIHNDINTDEAWQEFSAKIKMKKGKTGLKAYYKYMLAACVVGIILTVAILYKFSNQQVEKQQQYTSTTISTRRLPDSSTAVMNVNSNISFPERFNAVTREVAFEGEGFFDVTPDKHKPFEITVDDIKIKVVGTSFNVRQIKQQLIEVQVVTGIVEMHSADKMISISKGQRGIYDYSGKSLGLENNTDINSFSYATKQFIFNDTPFRTACKYLEKAFHVNIKIDDSVSSESGITSSFKNKSLEYILDVICSTVNAEYIKHNDIIIIKNNNSK